MKPAGWKKMLVHELIEYWITFAYLLVFLLAFVWYRRLVLAEYQIEYTHYWFPVIEAAVLAKVILIGDAMRLGRRVEGGPLILPTLYRTLVFAVWIAVFSVLEATVRGLIHGHGWTGGLEEIADKGRYELLAWGIVAFVAFVPFFGLKELDRALGDGRLRALFWKRPTLHIEKG
jgi:hypothetical protein